MVAPFDEILSPSELRSARIVKIDIEGAEFPVLSRILTRIGDFRRDIEIVVELACPAEPERRRLANKVIRDFKDAGFLCYRLTNDFSIPRYLSKTAALPALRLVTEISETTDVIFSREDADFI